MHTPTKTRPSKYRTECVSMLREMTDRGMTLSAMTDRDLFFMMNEMLGHGHHVCYRTFQRYKAEAVAFGDANVEERAGYDSIYETLWHTMQRNSISQKDNLFQAMIDSTGTEWHKYRWILERKYPEFNLSHQTKMLEQEHLYIQSIQNPTNTMAKKTAPKEDEEAHPRKDLPMPNIKIAGYENEDWYPYYMQQQRKMLHELSGSTEDFNEDPLPEPTRFVKTVTEQEKEQIELEEAKATLEPEALVEYQMEQFRADSIFQNEKALGNTMTFNEKAAFIRGQKQNEDTQRLLLERDMKPRTKKILPILNLADTSPLKLVHSNMENSSPTPDTEDNKVTGHNNPWIKPDGTMRTNAEFMELGKQRTTPLFPDREPEPTEPPDKPTPSGGKRILGMG